MPHMSVRPSKLGSALGLIVGLLMLVLVIVVFVPVFFGASREFPPDTPGVNQGGADAIGIFIAVFMLVCVASAGFYAYNLLGGRGAGFLDIGVDESGGKPGATASKSHAVRRVPGRNDFEVRLRKLNKLRADGLITDEEFQAKRAEIMGEQW